MNYISLIDATTGNDFLHHCGKKNNIVPLGLQACYRQNRTMDVLLYGHSISAKGELQLLRCLMGKTMSYRCHLLAANGWRLID